MKQFIQQLLTVVGNCETLLRIVKDDLTNRDRRRLQLTGLMS